MPPTYPIKQGWVDGVRTAVLECVNEIPRCRIIAERTEEMTLIFVLSASPTSELHTLLTGKLGQHRKLGAVGATAIFTAQPVLVESTDCDGGSLKSQLRLAIRVPVAAFLPSSTSWTSWILSLLIVVAIVLCAILLMSFVVCPTERCGQSTRTDYYNS
jgi:hypothetical protein